MAEVNFTEAAIDDLRRIGPDAVPKVLKKVLLLEENPEAGYPLGGELTGFRKLVVGHNTWRIVYRITDDKTVEVCEVWAVGARADAEVHAEATARIKAVGPTRPELVKREDYHQQYLDKYPGGGYCGIGPNGMSSRSGWRRPQIADHRSPWTHHRRQGK
jgi:addiction module RelE/StbE family toxin